MPPTLRAGAHSGEVEIRAYDVVLYLLGEVAEMRAEHSKRCESPAYGQVPEVRTTRVSKTQSNTHVCMNASSERNHTKIEQHVT